MLPASIDQKPVVRRLLELYLHDFSELDGREVDADGRFGYRYLDAYWTEAERHPFLFRVDGRWCGFAFVRTGGVTSMAEFFVLRKHRRSGIGLDAARQVFARFPGPWLVEQIAANDGAHAFWLRAIPVECTDERTANGWEQRFTIPTT